MKNFFYVLIGSAVVLSCGQPKQQQEEQPAKETVVTQQPAELIMDQKYANIGREGIAALSSGDVASWMNSFADNAVFDWSSGDSLVGKKAITDYWTDRRGKVIDKLVIKSDIWYTMKINQPQKGPDAPGVWLMNWLQIETTYKNGATVRMWIHNDMHFNSSDKIDRMIQYLDRAPIAAALAKKK
ncbi:MAG TPA: nuclear transport factor 2 family protein [Cyclobacteriaceae bacterium]|nr:nuclear transport factor 2 family protein [Cyclobacteriaceae bacterium]